MPALLAFADPVGVRADGVGHRGVEVELRAQLVEVGDADLRAEPDFAGVGLQRAQDQLEQRRLAGAVRADESDAVAAHHAQVEVAHHGATVEALLTLRNSATSLPERSPESTVSFTLPSRSRRASRSRRSCSRRLTRPSLRVRRASTPLRIQTSSCAQNLSNLRLSTASSASCSALRRS